MKGHETDGSGVKPFPKHCNLTGGQNFRPFFSLFSFICIFQGRVLIFPKLLFKARSPSEARLL